MIGRFFSTLLLLFIAELTWPFSSVTPINPDYLVAYRIGPFFPLVLFPPTCSPLVVEIFPRDSNWKDSLLVGGTF